MRLNRVSAFFFITAIFVFILSACGGGAATEAPAEPTPESAPTVESTPSFAVILAGDLLKSQECTSSDFFRKGENIFLRINKGLEVCSPDAIDASDPDAAVNIGDMIFLETVCTNVFEEGREWDEHSTFADNLGQYRIERDKINALDLGVQECFQYASDKYIPVEYYECRDNVYIYRDVSQIAGCSGTGIRYFDTMFDVIDKSLCTSEDYTQIRRTTDGEEYYDLFVWIPDPDKKYVDIELAMLMDEEGKICNPFNENMRVLEDAYNFCDPLEDAVLDGLRPRYGYCIREDRETEAKPYVCKLPDSGIEFFVLDPYSEEESDYLGWYCDTDAPASLIMPRTIVDFYEMHPEYCQYQNYYRDDYSIYEMVADHDNLVCNPFTGEHVPAFYSPPVHEFCDLGYEEPDYSLSTGYCLGENHDIPAVAEVCTTDLPITHIAFTTSIVRYVPYDKIYGLKWKCDGSFYGKTKSVKEMYRMNCPSNYYEIYYEEKDNVEEIRIYEDQGMLCCPYDDEDNRIVPIETGCRKTDESPNIDPENNVFECQDGNIVSRYDTLLSFTLDSQSRVIFSYPVYRHIDPQTTYKYCDNGEAKDKPLSLIATDHYCYEGSDWVKYDKVMGEKNTESPNEDIMLVMDSAGNVCNPFTGQRMHADYFEQEPGQFFCFDYYDDTSTFQCLDDREIHVANCVFNPQNSFVGNSWRYDHDVTNVRVLKELFGKEALFNCEDTDFDGYYEIVPKGLDELYIETGCPGNFDHYYILCDPENQANCNRFGVLMLTGPRRTVCNPFTGEIIPIDDFCTLDIIEEKNQLGAMCYNDQHLPIIIHRCEGYTPELEDFDFDFNFDLIYHEADIAGDCVTSDGGLTYEYQSLLP
ncbi:MAG: hypothetical protein KKF44_03665 [Nanoarchaeota archaeon]|nr:hypothetical protein [Nanoarchaeota archaeon]